MDQNISDLIDNIRKAIHKIRNRNYDNLRLLIESLENADDFEKKSFETWDGKLGIILGKGTCREIGKQVCKQEHFTIKEGMLLLEAYRQQETMRLGLEGNASWLEINKAIIDRTNKAMCDDAI